MEDIFKGQIVQLVITRISETEYKIAFMSRDATVDSCTYNDLNDFINDIEEDLLEMTIV